MNGTIRAVLLAGVVVAVVPARAAPPPGSRTTPVPPYGAADFVPTPETPTGFRADGNGWYPGANPPAEWWEGTPTRVTMHTASGNRAFDPERDADGKAVSVWTTGDARSKNVLWRAPIPGWGDAQPILVGDRLIATCDPDVVICYDAGTGKRLWQDRLKVMTLPVLGDDRRTLSPAPAGAKAQAAQTAWELARAMYFVRVQGGGGGIGGGGQGEFLEDENWPRHRPVIEQCHARLRQWRGLLTGDLAPALGQGMDAAADVLQDVLAARDADARIEAWSTLNRKNPYLEAFKRQYRVTTFITWQGHVGGAFSTPVSDGHVAVVCFAYGQIGAYDVASGKRVWAFRDGLVPEVQYVNHGASLWMYKDLVLVRAGDGQAILGLDKATGAVRWETQIQMHARGKGANHGNYITPVLMDVPVKGGGMRKVLVTQEPPVLDPLTGTVLGRLEIKGPKPRSDRGTMVGRDGHLMTGWGYDAPASPTYGFRLAMDAGTLAIAKAPNLEGNQERGTFGATPILYRPGVMVGLHDELYDPETGVRLFGPTSGLVPRTGEGSPAVLCGDLLVTRESQNPFNRVRQDFSAVATFWVSDARDPLQPRLLSERNLLGSAAMPADPIWDTYMAGFDKRRNVGCYLGLPAWFGCRVGGVVPRGDRLYIQSALGMYCVGPAVKGTPADDATVVAAVRSAGTEAELVKFLGSASAQYRYEAVKALAVLKVRPSDALTARLKTLAVEDPYEEVRAVAVLMLDAADPASAAGTALVRDEVVAGLKEYRWWIIETHGRLRTAVLTFRAMGSLGKDILARRIAAAKEPAALGAWYHLAFELNLDIPAATDRALQVVADAKSDRYLAGECGRYLADTAWRDERVLPALRRSPHFGGPMLEAVCMRTPVADLSAALEDVLRNQRIENHVWPVVVRGCRRLGAERAVPMLKRVAAGRPDFAQKMGQILAAIQVPDLDPRPEAQPAEE